VRVLVTGGAGYVGYSVVGALLAADVVERVVVVDNLSRGEFALFRGGRGGERAEFVEADVLDGRSLARVVADVDAVIHLAAAVQSPTQDTEAHAFDQVNNWGTAQLAGVIEDSEVTTVLYLSSVTVYGTSDGLLTIESAPTPNTFYGVTKLRGEGHLTRLATDDRRVIVVRAGNVYGINAAVRFDTVVNRFLLDGRFKRRLKVLGSGEQIRSLIEVERLARALVAIVTSDTGSCTVNFVDHATSVLDVARLVCDLSPGIEVLHIDREMPMLDARVEGSPLLVDLVGPADDLADDLARSWASLEI
jgi:UDP-glucose 4-epimerase